jgi:hypothetical protein
MAPAVIDILGALGAVGHAALRPDRVPRAPGGCRGDRRGPGRLALPERAPRRGSSRLSGSLRSGRAGGKPRSQAVGQAGQGAFPPPDGDGRCGPRPLLRRLPEALVGGVHPEIHPAGHPDARPRAPADPRGRRAGQRREHSLSRVPRRPAGSRDRGQHDLVADPGERKTGPRPLGFTNRRCGRVLRLSSHQSVQVCAIPST